MLMTGKAKMMHHKEQKENMKKMQGRGHVGQGRKSSTGEQNTVGEKEEVGKSRRKGGGGK